MPYASDGVAGFVESPAQARRITVHAIRAIENTVKYETAQNQFAAYRHGGHQAHGGQPWVPLSPVTVQIKRRLGYPNPAAPLVRTGKMSASTRVRVNLQSTGRGIRFTILAWNIAPYSGWHEKRVRNHWTGTFNPIRRPVDFTAADLARVRQIIASYIHGAEPDGSSARKRGQGARAGIATRAGGAVKRFFRRFFGR